MKLNELFEENNITFEQKSNIEKSIKEYIKKPESDVKSTVWLVNQAFKVNNVEIPDKLNDPNYTIYTNILMDTAKKLQKSTDAGIRDDSWKITSDDSPYV